MTRRACRSLLALIGALVIPAGLLVSEPAAAPATASQPPPPARCPVHFLGLHGLDEQSDLTSPTINATWKAFQSAVTAKALPPKRDSIAFPKVARNEFLAKNSVIGIEPDVNVGVAAIQKAMDRAVRSCSSTRFVLVGYSLGAWVVDKFLVTDPHRRQLVRAAQLYGDPQWRAPGKGKGLAVAFNRGLRTPYPPSADKVQSLCNQRDPVCGTGYRDDGRDLVQRLKDLQAPVKCPGSEHCYSGRSTTQGGEFLASRIAADWSNRTYGVTCGDTVSKAVPVAMRNGRGLVKAGRSDIANYDRWNVRIQRIAAGKVPRLGDVTAVLFWCRPQPSNFSVQELRVYRTADGREVGRTPAFDVDGLTPIYQPGTVAFRNGRLLADVKFYGPDDTHATGPSILRHVTWAWDGSHFVKRTEVDANTPNRTDLSAQRITVNGMGPLRLGMSRTQAERAVGAPIPVGPGGPDCTDLSIEGGPPGLLLRFSNEDRLVAIYVLSQASTSLKTASGIHVGSTRDDVMTTYEPDLMVNQIGSGIEELVFTPGGSQFQGKIITFLMNDQGAVDSFIAGERDFANPLPCGGD
ncbi:cutinase family protein [Streptomyces sp. 24-1644]|uniref:cutinase family protein n=1 Tax=Streptomyces sp. 24-1644 TaxID=3457315 RepID=UPI003FA7C790